MGSSTAFYRRSLLSIVSVDLPRSQCICFSCFLLVFMCFAMSVLYRDACPGISLNFSGVDQHCPFALWDRFGCVG
jgi:hypothetical protein